MVWVFSKSRDNETWPALFCLGKPQVICCQGILLEAHGTKRSKEVSPAVGFPFLGGPVNRRLDKCWCLTSMTLDVPVLFYVCFLVNYMFFDQKHIANIKLYALDAEDSFALCHSEMVHRYGNVFQAKHPWIPWLLHQDGHFTALVLSETEVVCRVQQHECLGKPESGTGVDFWNTLELDAWNHDQRG